MMKHSMDPEGMIPRQEDFDAIWQATLDYVDGWYNGDGERMGRCLHPDLVKRTIEWDKDRGEFQLRRPTTADMMVAYTEEGGGTEVPESERLYQLTIVDIFRHIAMVKCVSPLYVDYVQLANFGDRGWLIVNVLWEQLEGEIESGE
jgi:hypothetical protein